MSPPRSSIGIAGAGPAGALLAILLRRRGFEVTLYERRADPRGRPFDSGRSINLAMAERGINALRVAGVVDRFHDTLIPMRGRLVHDAAGATQLQPYGQRPDEVIYSISRHLLNATLIDVAVREAGAQIHFETDVIDVAPAEGRLTLQDVNGGAMREVAHAVLIAADGGGSAVRARLAERGRVQSRTEPLAHSYKELTIPPSADGTPAMPPEALHIWPRGSFMLIALPNPDHSFTATLFLETGRFGQLREPAAIEAFLRREFPDAAALMPARIEEFIEHPTGHLGTVYCLPWRVDGRVLLFGDAAHAIVPFHGQGMNCCFEDCVQFDALLDAHEEWEPLFADFEQRRKPNTDAIAAMALENYLEMRERVVDARFQLQKQLSLELERRHPQRFIPRYSMVSFRHDIGYAEARRRGELQQRILDDLTSSVASLEQIDYEQAAAQILSVLPPITSSAF
jgi:kynurenine 3-monooxygenase